MSRKDGAGYNFNKAPNQRLVLLEIAENEPMSILALSKRLGKSYNRIHDAHNVLQQAKLLKSVATKKSNPYWWLSRKGVGVAFLEGSDLDVIEKLAKEVYKRNPPELEKLSYVFEMGRAMGREGFRKMMNFDFSDMQVTEGLIKMVMTNPSITDYIAKNKDRLVSKRLFKEIKKNLE
jgi:hypothetical protein